MIMHMPQVHLHCILLDCPTWLLVGIVYWTFSQHDPFQGAFPMFRLSMVFSAVLVLLSCQYFRSSSKLVDQKLARRIYGCLLILQGITMKEILECQYFAHPDDLESISKYQMIHRLLLVMQFLVQCVLLVDIFHFIRNVEDLDFEEEERVPIEPSSFPPSLCNTV